MQHSKSWHFSRSLKKKLLPEMIFLGAAIAVGLAAHHFLMPLEKLNFQHLLILISFSPLLLWLISLGVEVKLLSTHKIKSGALILVPLFYSCFGFVIKIITRAANCRNGNDPILVHCDFSSPSVSYTISHLVNDLEFLWIIGFFILVPLSVLLNLWLIRLIIFQLYGMLSPKNVKKNAP